jgi:EmrB/QacA subfamily drug resistance transporter
MTTDSTTDWSISAPAVPPNSRRWLALAVVLTGAFMILLDSTIVNVAIPSIQVDLGASYGGIEWVISGYALAYGLLLIPAGRLGDRFGYRGMFLFGLAGFIVTSALCGTAETPGQLIAWRVLQGAMAGIINPQILAVIQVAFPARERGRAYSLYGAISGIAVAAGPLLGGLLIEADISNLDWRPIFLLNIPIGLLALAAAPRLVPTAKGRGGSLDLVGVALVSATVLLLTVPLVQGREAGWPAWSWICLTLVLPTAALFAWWEARRLRLGRGALVDIRLFRNRSFTAGVAIGLTYFAGFIGLFFVLSLHLQLGLDRSAWVTGLTLLPFAAGSFAGAALSDRISARLGRGVLFIGAALVIAGTLGVIVTLMVAGAQMTGLQLLPALLLTGVGSGLVISPNVDIVLATVPWQEAGAASGVLNTAQRLGNALGVAVVGVALFGALGSHAVTSADRSAAALRSDLVAAGQDSSTAARGAVAFADCYVAQSTAADPTRTPPGCPAPTRGDPVAGAYAAAADRAQADNFTRAAVVASWWSLAAIVVTFLLVFLLPRGRPRQSWN